MGRPRKPDEQKSTTIFVKLPNPLLWKLEEEAGEEGKPQDVLLRILEDYYKKRDCQNP